MKGKKNYHILAARTKHICDKSFSIKLYSGVEYVMKFRFKNRTLKASERENTGTWIRRYESTTILAVLHQACSSFSVNFQHLCVSLSSKLSSKCTNNA